MVVGLFFVSCQTPKPLSFIPANQQWELVASDDGSLPVARHEAAFVGVTDNLFLLGGRRNNPTSIFKHWQNYI